MKKILFGLVLLTAFVACSNDYGEKVTIEGTKGEVFYKEGATEREARQLGDYLKKEGYFDQDDKSVQLMKINDGYDVHFVVNKEKIDSTPGMEDRFAAFGIRISENVFSGKPVNIFLSDTKLKDFKSLPYDKQKAEELAGTDKIDPTDATGWDEQKVGDVTFHWKWMTDEESKRIADYIIQNGSFSGGTSNIYMTKEDGRHILRFPVIASARNNETYIAQVEKVAKEIKDNVFANEPYSFYITDENMTTVKAFDH